jgi:uncharacterized membrane protein YhaH (DUF805 family)
MHWYLDVLKKYAVFEGRARRSEYWFFVLFNLLITIALIFIDAFMATMDPQVGIGVLSGLYSLGVLIPSISVLVRRLHDTNRSGWWFLLAFVPLLNLVLLVFMFLDGTAGDNDYGRDPKGPPRD